MEAQAGAQPRSLRGATRPSDLAVAAFHPYQDELVNALWTPDRSLAYYDIALPKGVHLDRPTLESKESRFSIHLSYYWGH